MNVFNILVEDTFHVCTASKLSTFAHRKSGSIKCVYNFCYQFKTSVFLLNSIKKQLKNKGRRNVLHNLYVISTLFPICLHRGSWRVSKKSHLYLKLWFVLLVYKKVFLFYRRNESYAFCFVDHKWNQTVRKCIRKFIFNRGHIFLKMWSTQVYCKSDNLRLEKIYTSNAVSLKPCKISRAYGNKIKTLEW